MSIQFVRGRGGHGKDRPAVRDQFCWACEEESGPSYAPSGPLPGTFLGPALDIRSDNLYDLPTELQDVMGLRVVRPGAVVAKVMSIRNSRCITVTKSECVSYRGPPMFE